MQKSSLTSYLAILELYRNHSVDAGSRVQLLQIPPLDGVARANQAQGLALHRIILASVCDLQLWEQLVANHQT